MKITLKNIGILRDAEVEIVGITTIAGENNTGKSTVGKALYAIFDALYKFDQRVLDAKKELIARFLFNLLASKEEGLGLLSDFPFARLDQFVDSLNEELKNKNAWNLVEPLIREFIVKNELPHDKAENALQDIKKVLSIEESRLHRIVVERSLTAEFNEQIHNLYVPNEQSSIGLQINKSETQVLLEKDDVNAVKSPMILWCQPVYIDDPHVIDSLSSGYFSRRMRHHTAATILNLKKSVSSDMADAMSQVLRQDKLASIWNRFSEICSGRLVGENSEFKFVDKNNPKLKFDPRNLSMGLKTFLILQELILNGTIVERGTIILDEPEIHLHPEWQVILAELIVVLQKTLGLHILITTHSPYFVSALEVFSKKHEIDKDSRYYFVKKEEDCPVITDVTGDITEIYSSLAAPFQKIEDAKF